MKNIMRGNEMGYLGLLGLLGLLGAVGGGAGFFGFFGFFGFLSLLRGRGGDERLDRKLNCASRNAFLFTVVASACFAACMAVLQATQVYESAFLVLFAGSALTFGASFAYYNERGD
jgi:hypothetical protein